MSVIGGKEDDRIFFLIKLWNRVVCLVYLLTTDLISESLNGKLPYVQAFLSNNVILSFDKLFYRLYEVDLSLIVKCFSNESRELFASAPFFMVLRLSTIGAYH